MRSNSFGVDFIESRKRILRCLLDRPAKHALSGRARDDQRTVDRMDAKWYSQRREYASLHFRAIASRERDKLVRRDQESSHRVFACIGQGS
jgi:hypothetical protein